VSTAFPIADLRRLGRILADAAEAEIMPRFRHLGQGEIHEKTSAFDVVTAADEAAEAAIVAALCAAFPGAVIVGEEGAGRDPGLFDALGSAELAFVVDPIDGTKNFTANLPLFGLMAAAVMQGEIVAGVILDPVCGDWAYAVRDGGAWLERPDGGRAPLRVAEPVAVSRMDGIVGTNFLPEPLRGTVAANLSRVGMTSWLRCSAHEYRMAAAGHCHLLVYNRLMPWDHAAGWLLHREAGGYSAHFDGTPYLPTHRTGGLICAPDRASWQAARDALLTG
jgi:fructose-1,6-bisphosphatase/inositol monophosphatase family enzyme